LTRRNKFGILEIDPDDFIISDSEFLPTAEEGLDQAQTLQLKEYAQNNGNKLYNYKKIVRDSLAVLRNWQEVKKTYYIHSTRKDVFRAGFSDMYSVNKDASQPHLYPKEPYTNNTSYYMPHSQVYKIL
jgi:hypothetical protein